MMTPLIHILSTALLVAALDREPQKPLMVERIEARVGSEIITSTDVELTIARLQANLPEKKQRETLERRALNELVDEAIVRDYLRRLQMEVTEQEVDRQINSIRLSNGISSLEDFQRMLELQGTNFNRYRAEIRRQMEMSQFDQVVKRQQLQSFDQRELRSFFEENKEMFEANYEVALQECVLMPDQAEMSALRALAQRVQSGSVDFEECVRRHSRSPSVSRNGNLGTVSRGALRREVEDKVFAAQVNEVVSIEMPQAIQLLRVTDKRNLGPRSFDDVQSEIRQHLESQRMMSAREKTLEHLKNTTFIRLGS